VNFMEREKPIGVFDSGIGGLTVVKRLSSYLPKEGIVYFGDTARVPYGSKSNDTVIEYAIQDAAYLMQKGIKLLVVACNTVSSVALQELRNRFPLPIIGMIEPGANMALKETKTGRIGIIGTMATVNNKAYSNELKRLDPKVEVFETACPLFVPFAEEGWLKHKALYLVAEEYLKELKEKEIDTLVLGCTHYPLLADVIQEVMGDNVKLIDSGIAAAHAANTALEGRQLFTNSAVPGENRFFVSDIPAKFQQIAELFLGKSIKVDKIDLETLVKCGKV